jgi:SPP1 family predicted phage head-tail adaptor
MASRVGQLRDRVVIQSKTPSSDTQGGRAVSWGTLATVWARVQALTAAEQMAAQAVSSRVRYEVEIQYRTDVTPAMRLSWTPYLGSAKTVEILGVRVKDGKPERLVLDCGEVA